MKMRTTCLKDHSCRVTRARASQAGSSRTGSVPKKIWQEICPSTRFFALGIIGLAVWVIGAHPRSATARQTAPTDERQRTTLRGIRDPLNPEAYMQELAGRLNSGKEKETLLRGVKPTGVVPAPTAATRQPAMTEETLREQPRMEMPSAQRPSVQRVDLRHLVAEELERQRASQQQAAQQEQELRRLIAEEVGRMTQPATPVQQPQVRTMTEQDLRALIAAELTRQGMPLPQADAPAEGTQPDSTEAQVAQSTEDAPDDLQTLIARELDRQQQDRAPAALAEPNVMSNAIAEPALAETAPQQEDLQALIARELERRRQREAQAMPAQPQVTSRAIEERSSDETPVTTEQVRALIARELDRQGQGTTAAPPATEPAPTTEPDLQTLITQELERRRAANGVGTLKSDPLVSRSRPPTSGVSSVTGLAPDNRAAYRAYRDIQAQRGLADPDEPWTLGRDLDRYRAYAVSEGSRSSGESLRKALKRVGLTLEDGANIFTLGYASDRGERFRANDGKGFFQEPGNVPRQAGRTIVTFGDGLYSLVDLLLFDMLANKNKDAYQDNNPLVRPLVYTGKTVGGLWRTTEELGNALTWGYFDNLTGSAGMCFEDIIEVLKHTGQAVTNVARVPVHLLGGKDGGADRALDWVLLVPLELASNIVEMQGFSNMDDYQTAFAEKGVIGSILEFGGSTYVVYRAVDELVDELDDKNKNGNGNTGSSQPAPETPTEPTTPATPVTPAEPPVVPEIPVEPVGDVVFYWALR